MHEGELSIYIDEDYSDFRIANMVALVKTKINKDEI